MTSTPKPYNLPGVRMTLPFSVPARLSWIYFLGALLTFSLAVISVWANLEASYYGFERRGDRPISGFSCPILMNPHETGTVWLKIKNTTDKPLSPSVRAEFSTPMVAASTVQSIDLAPGETRQLTWSINSSNIDLKNFIFSKVSTFAFYPVPDSEGTCGTFIINTPIPGNVLLIVWVILGLAGIWISWYLLSRSVNASGRVQLAVRPLNFLSVLLTLDLILGLMGWWFQAVLFLAITLLATFVILNHIFLTEID